jgi:hypothetical protein
MEIFCLPFQDLPRDRSGTFNIANNVKGMAVVTFYDRMILAEFFPVLSLLRRQDPCPPAKRTYIFQRCQDCMPDKLGAVGNAFHCLSQPSVDLEGYDFIFLLGHKYLDPFLSW